MISILMISNEPNLFKFVNKINYCCQNWFFVKNLKVFSENYSLIFSSQIILNEIKFCYLFANYRSRIYSTVDHVIKFNDIVYHPVLLGREEGLAITLEEVVQSNVEVAALYIARFVVDICRGDCWVKWDFLE